MSRWCILVLTLLFSYGSTTDLCLEFDEQADISGYLQISATPVAGLKAGVYRKDESAKDLVSCVLRCCANANCNIVFLHDSDCYLITCNSSRGCEPQIREEDKYENTYMISVRSLQNVIEETNPDLEVDPECDFYSSTDCGEHGVCDYQISDSAAGYVCVCDEGYVLKEGTCVGKDVPQPVEDKNCEIGLSEHCGAHEECVGLNSRSRSGFCQCVEGYVKDKDTRLCAPRTDNKSTTSPSTPPSTKSPNTDTDSSKSSGGSTTFSSTNVEVIPPKSTESLSEGRMNGTFTSSASKSVETESSKSSESSSADRSNSSSSSTSSSSTSTSSTSTSHSTTTTSSSRLENIVVSAGGSKEIRLPENEITLQAYTSVEGDMTYQWSVVSHPSGNSYGTQDGINTPSLYLKNLVEGEYKFKVVVTAPGRYGEATVNVTVHPPVRENKPPEAIIRPASQQVHAPNNVVIDGSESKDDDKIVAYRWEQVSGPLGSSTPDADLMSGATLVLPGLIAGDYKFKLTVTDSDGLESYAFSNVTVIKEIDYPPKANAGSDVIISLPTHSVKLYGNSSTDDKGIASYEWIKASDDKLTADMTGVRTPVLQLDNLDEGDYTFTLKVTDTAGQTDRADVRVFVKAASNKAPVAVLAKSEATVLLPTDSFILDGTNSTDDQGIYGYSWSQVSGPASVAIDNADRAVATVSGLRKGVYKFKLVVSDQEGLQGEATATLTVKENENHYPKANAGGDKIVHLPARYVTVDGSQSTDDKKIVSYLWTRSPKSLATGVVLNNSDHQAVLQLSELVAGRFIFILEVKDEEGLSSTDTASLIVQESLFEDDLIEMELKADIHYFTEANKENLRNEIGLLLHKQTEDGDTRVNIESIEPGSDSQKTRIIFYVSSVNPTSSSRVSGSSPEVVWSGTEVVAALRNKLMTSHDVFDFTVATLDTLVCQNNCSNHGHCSQATKRCECDTFWMENFIKANVGSRESNCDWSILYVIIVSFVIVITLAGCIAACICLGSRWYCSRPKKRHRYELLKEVDSGEGISMVPKGKAQSNSIMVSESDFSSDEATLFISKTPSNGHLRNGYKSRNKVRT